MKNIRKGQRGLSPSSTNEWALLKKIEGSAGAGNLSRKLSGIRLGIGDDAALWAPRTGYETVLTTDWFLEGIHFVRDVHPPTAVGWKCLARAISDVAAMGGEPRCCLVSLALPLQFAQKWLDGFLIGLRRAARTFSCPLAGGDTTSWKQILINVCVIGEARIGKAARRSGASPGDRIFVSGKLGEAELGLRVLRKTKGVIKAEHALLQKHLYPEPRIALGRWLASNRLAAAMMDLSDGLSSDLARLCSASGVGARIYPEKLPLASGGFSREFEKKYLVHAALHGGDDYELLFCVGQNTALKMPRSLRGIRLTEIGEVTKDREISVIDSSGKQSPLKAAGWDPFRK